MDDALFRKLLERPHIPTPGDSSFVSSPERNRPIEAAVIHHHRLAFYYWVRWTTKDFTSSLPTENQAPDLRVPTILSSHMATTCRSASRSGSWPLLASARRGFRCQD